MESFPAPKPQDRHELIELIGPDGWKFSVAKSAPLQLEAPNSFASEPGILGSPSPAGELEATVETPQETSGLTPESQGIGLSVTEIGLGSVALGAAGLYAYKRLRNGPARAARMKTIKREAGAENLASTAPKPPYDPLKSWQSKHRTRKLENDPQLLNYGIHSQRSGIIPETKHEQRVHIRANEDLNESLSLNLEVQRLRDTYGWWITNPEATAQYLETQPLTRTQKKEIKRAGRLAKKYIDQHNGIREELRNPR